MTSISIAIVSYNSDSPDSFQFVALSQIDGSQKIIFTDNGVSSNGDFRANEGFATWTAPSSGVNLGEVVSINILDKSADVGSVNVDSGMAFSSSGDQLIAFVGTQQNPEFICAFNNKGSEFQTDATSSSTSALPPGLTLGFNAVAVKELDNVVYEGISSGSLSELTEALFNPDSFVGGSDSFVQTFGGTFNVGDIDITPFPTTMPPVVSPTTPFPTPSVTTVSGSRCGGYAKAPSKSDSAISIVEANDKALSGSSDSVILEGVVVNELLDFAAEGFYIQAPTTHQPNPPVEGDKLSQGIFVYCEGSCSGYNVKEGDYVRVEGKLGLFSESPQITSPNVELITPSVEADTGSCPDLSYEVHIVDVELPMNTLSSFKAFQGMLVNFNHNLVITDLFGLRYGQLGLAKERVINPTMQVGPGTEEYFAIEDSQKKGIIILDDVAGGSCPVPQLYFEPQEGIRAGWGVDIDATAVMTYFDVTDQFFMIPNSKGREFIPANFNKNLNPRDKVAPLKTDEIRMAGLNMLNYFTTLGCGNCRGADNEEEFYRQSVKLYSVIKELDAAILGLQEVQNFDGEVLEQMTREINSFIGSDEYSFIAAGQIGGDAIKNSIIYKSSLLTPVGSFKTLPFDNPSDKSRPALAQAFSVNGASSDSTFTFVVNHLKSKGSGCSEDSSGNNVLEGEGNCGFARQKHAEQLVEWLKTDPTGTGNDNYVLVGDFNSYKEERAIKVITQEGFVNMAERDVDAQNLYSTSFDGRFGTLDYIFASDAMANVCGNTKEWHINSDETVLIDYNDEQASFPSSCSTKPQEYYDLSVHRCSDHDPIITSCFFSSVKNGDVVDTSGSKIDGAVVFTGGLFALMFVLVGLMYKYSKKKVVSVSETEGDITQYTL